MDCGKNGCMTELTSHGFMHAHGFRGGNYIGPVTVFFRHEAERNHVEVRVKVPDGEIVVQGTLAAPEDALYCDVDEFDEQTNCFSRR